MTPTFSIVMPLFNGEPYIEVALRSILDQTFRSWELIVVDDGSVDRGAQIARDLDDPRVRVLTNPHNIGCWASRNRGLDVSRGRWVTFLDCDDWYGSTRLEDLLEQCERLESDILFDDLACHVGEPPRRIRTTFESRGMSLDSPRPLTASEFVQLDLGVCKPVIRRSFLESHNVRFSNELRAGGDFPMFLTCILRGGKAHVVPTAGYNYRFRPGQITSDREQMLIAKLAATRIALEEAQAAGDDACSAALARRIQDVGSQRAVRHAVLALRNRDLLRAVRTVIAQPGSIVYAVERMARWRRWYDAARVAVSRTRRAT